MTALKSALALARAVVAAAIVLASASAAFAQANPDLVLDSGVTEIALPADGVLRYGNVTLHSGADLRFTRNAANTPVYILADGPVLIEQDAVIRVDGTPPNGANVGIGGPGGFAGGNAGFGTTPGYGEGPGGGRGGSPQWCCGTADRAGNGAFGCDGDGLPRSGTPYGNPVLLGLIGGSGGGGNDNGEAGGGGGGAILISSQVSITHRGIISAVGGNAGYSGDGSGGAVRLRAPLVAGNGSITVNGPSSNHGRIRIDAVDRSGIAFGYTPACAVTSGSIMTEMQPAAGTLRLTEVGGVAISSEETGQVLVNLTGASPKTVKVRVHGFGGLVPIEIALTPDQGERVTQVVNADMDTADGDGNVVVTATFPDFPTNVGTRVDAWTR